jgi:hypothetical protein
MDLYTYIHSLNDYFHSMRLHQGIILIDLKFPIDWIVKEVLNLHQTTTQLKVNDTSEEHQLLSFYSAFEKEAVETLTKDIERVIKYNKDQEEKRNLLNLKILELKKIFDTNEVNALRGIDFNFGIDNNVPPTLKKSSENENK